MNSSSKIDNYLFNCQFLLLIIISPTFFLGGFIPGVCLVLISLIYIYFFFRHKLYDLCKKKYVLFFLLFNFSLIISSLLSNHIKLSLEYSLVYFRYGLFALSITYLFINKPLFLKYFLLSIFVIFYIFLADSIFQFFSGNNIFDYPYDPYYRRLSGLFNDEQVLGLFLFKLFPILLFFIHLIYKNSIFHNSLYFISILLTLVTITLTGERTTLALFLIFITIYFFLSKRFLFQNLIIIFFSGLIFFSTFITKPDLYKRVIFETINQITSKNDISTITIFSPGHTRHYLTAVDIFKDNLIFGSGPKTFRKLCVDYPYQGCSTHPHNFLMQLLSETGLIGTTIGLLIYIFLISTLIKFRPKHKNNEYKEYFLIFISSLVVVYFPLLPSNNFFHQWINIQNYILIGFIMYTYNNIKK